MVQGILQQQVSVGYRKDCKMKELRLKYRGRDSWDRPVYEAEGKLYVDVDPRRDQRADICTKCNNEFDGEPDMPVSGDFRITFEPGRDTWD